MTKVSLIIPVYNEAPFLKRCLDSVVNQTDKSAQVIIVDDGSTDGSAEICDKYKKCGFEVYHKKNGGVSSARNFGMKKAKGEYITFLDSDDVLLPNAIQIMTKEAEQGFGIYQFGQYRFRRAEQMDHINLTIPYRAPKGYYDFDFIPKYWVIVWNKLYKRSLIEENNIKFRPGMQFGEDAMFSAECILANGGLYHASQATVVHLLDNKDSLCRGNLNKGKIQKLDDELCKLAEAQTDPEKKKWMETAVREHRNARLFKRYGVGSGRTGKYDIVYFVKDGPMNEELVYSLRSVEKNWLYRSVWFCGGCPEGLKPDRYFKIRQEGFSKWDKVRNMIARVCQNDEITEDFWLFNDDFFILKPMVPDMPPQYNGTLISYIERIERKTGPDGYTERLRHAERDLVAKGFSTLNYEVHKPMLINRKKALEVMEKFPTTPCFRSLYGNYCGIGGNDRHDMKIKVLNYRNMPMVESFWDFVSTSDVSFRDGEIGRFIRQQFNKESRFEDDN